MQFLLCLVPHLHLLIQNLSEICPLHTQFNNNKNLISKNSLILSNLQLHALGFHINLFAGTPINQFFTFTLLFLICYIFKNDLESTSAMVCINIT